MAAEKNGSELDDEDNKEDENTNNDEIDHEDGKRKKKTKKKKKKWDLEEHLGSVQIKLSIKFDRNRGQEKLKEAGWCCNSRGKIIGMKDGASPKPNDCPETYLIQQYVSFILTDDQYYNFNLIRIKQNEELKVARSNIYLSNDYQTKNTVLMVIPGTGVVNAGEFATSLCKFDNIIIGTAFPFIEWAIDQKRDYGVILFDPNTLSKIHENVLDEIHCVYVFDTYIKPYLLDSSNDNNNDQNEKKEETVEEAKKGNIQNLLILAHSAGGRRVTYLLKERGDIIKDYIKGIAFTDIKDPKDQVLKYERFGEKEKAKIVRTIYKEYSRNWIKTKTGKALDEAMKKGSKGALCKRVSSGHSDHKYTTSSAYPSIIKYFDEKMNVD